MGLERIKVWLFILLVICALILFSRNLLSLFVYYEFLLVVILLIISLDRYYFERYVLIIYLFVYMIVFSYLSLIFMIKNLFGINCFLIDCCNINVLGFYTVILIYLIKISIFGFHFWLLKVHCEVSMNLSILLSSLILKMGRFGIVRILMVLDEIFFFALVFYLGLLGFLYFVFFIFLVRDIKLVIASSSVVYMNLSLVILGLGKGIVLLSFFLINFFHSFRSLLLFWLRGLLYMYRGRRILIYTNSFKLLTGFIGVLSLMIFCFGINCPLTIRFISELFLMSLIYSRNKFLFVCLIFLLLVVFLYLLIYYSNLMYGTGFYFYVNNYLSVIYFIFLFIFRVLVFFIFLKIDFFI